jgi:hypothetical protein
MANELGKRDAEVVRVIEQLRQATDELMTEFVSKTRAAKWGVINDALVDGAKLIAKLKARGNRNGE